MSDFDSSLSLTAKQLRNFQKKTATSLTHSYGGVPCLEWMASRTRMGYGYFKLNNKLQRSHRVAWVIAHGNIPTDKPCVLHHCDNPPCVNAAHLFVGTREDNNRDKAAKGRGNQPKGDKHSARLHPERMARGDKHGRAKLAESDIPEIFRLRAAGMTLEEIAIVFGVSLRLISMVLRREIWKDVVS